MHVRKLTKDYTVIKPTLKQGFSLFGLGMPDKVYLDCIDRGSGEVTQLDFKRSNLNILNDTSDNMFLRLNFSDYLPENPLEVSHLSSNFDSFLYQLDSKPELHLPENYRLGNIK